LTEHKRPWIRPCPVCGIAMQASKSQEELTDFDTFRCLNCQSTIQVTKPQPPDNGQAP